MRAKLLDKHGNEVPRSEYELELTEDTFSFKFPDEEDADGKKLLRRRKGRYTVVLSNDAGETPIDLNMNFLSESYF